MYPGPRLALTVIALGVFFRVMAGRRGGSAWYTTVGLLQARARIQGSRLHLIIKRSVTISSFGMDAKSSTLGFFMLVRSSIKYKDLDFPAIGKF